MWKKQFNASLIADAEKNHSYVLNRIKKSPTRINPNVRVDIPKRSAKRTQPDIIRSDTFQHQYTPTHTQTHDYSHQHPQKNSFSHPDWKNYTKKPQQPITPSLKIINRIKDNLALINQQVELLFAGEIDPEEAEVGVKSPGKRCIQRSRINSTGRSSSVKRLREKLRTEGPVVGWKNNEESKSSMGPSSTWK